jgi:hypothetical protein
MRRIGRLAATLVLTAAMLSGCVVSGSSCSCALGPTYEGTFYLQYANTSVRADRSLGESDPDAQNCCGEPVSQVPVFSIRGIEPEIAIATKDADGKTYFNVARGLSERQERIAERFAKKHHQPGSTPSER